MYKKSKLSGNEKISLPKTAQDVMNTSCQNSIETSCCIDTTKITSSDIKTSCCIDTTKG